MLAPSFAEFWAGNGLELPQQPDDGGRLRAFREDPLGAPLHTPSGRIEIFSSTIAGSAEPDCPGHPAWLPPADAPAVNAPLILVANQPTTRLHSQLDFGGHSTEAKHRGREIACIHPEDAAARGISDGDIIRIFNHVAPASRACASRTGSGAASSSFRRVPDNPGGSGGGRPLCVHGNPNVLTLDVGTSALAQGCTGQLTTVEVERFDGNLPPIQAYDRPRTVSLAEVGGV